MYFLYSFLFDVDIFSKTSIICLIKKIICSIKTTPSIPEYSFEVQLLNLNFLLYGTSMFICKFNTILNNIKIVLIYLYAFMLFLWTE
jgi:hypothetical protein